MERNHPESHQYLDMVKLCEPATKWSTQIMDSLTIPTVMRKAFRVAQMEKPGSVAIVIRRTFLTQEIANKPLPIYPLPETAPVTRRSKRRLLSFKTE